MTVYLVGAGPGDVGLLTVRGRELLEAADAVVFDRLASAELLQLVPEGAERVSVGKGPGFAEKTQDEINACLVELGLKLETVVRLKGGDPFVFGRGGEEAAALIEAGVPFEVVPGITSAISAPAYAGIPVTHRGTSTHVTIVTGHEDPAKGHTDVNWEALAAAGGTLVILMGVGHRADIATRLMAGGLAPETPVAAVRNGTRLDQVTVRTTLGALGETPIVNPSAIVVGAVAALDYGWFEQRPLFGTRIVVTRAREQASELRERLEALGAQTIELPAIAIEPIDFELPALSTFDWLVCSSANGVALLFDAMTDAGWDARALADVQIAAIGQATADALAARGLRADFVPSRFVSEVFVEEFPDADSEGRVLIVRPEVARDELPDGLTAKGWQVELCLPYRTVVAEPDAAALEAVRAGAFDAITFTSSSTVTNTCQVVGAWPTVMPPVISIGPATSETVQANGLTVHTEADPHSIDGVIAALVDTLADGRSLPSHG